MSSLFSQRLESAPFLWHSIPLAAHPRGRPRDQKAQLAEDDYYNRLEQLMLKLAVLYHE